MTLSRVEQAARNNAIWCDTMCRAHGVAGEFHEAMWLNRNPAPRFYPNVVTLVEQRHVTDQLAQIQELAATFPGQWAIKDSFAIANRTDTVVGLSNLFAPAAESVACWAGCVATAQATFPGLPLVGYESGADLAHAEAVGFEQLHSLRVWGR